VQIVDAVQVHVLDVPTEERLHDHEKKNQEPNLSIFSGLITMNPVYGGAGLRPCRS
jgi:hypothetical protein